MSRALILGPTSHYFYSQRVKLHYVDWGNPEKPPLLLIHGGRDHARNWDWVAQALRDDYHIIAPDLRGHGDSQWSIGGSYAMIDYTLDVAQLLRACEQISIHAGGSAGTAASDAKRSGPADTSAGPVLRSPAEGGGLRSAGPTPSAGLSAVQIFPITIIGHSLGGSIALQYAGVYPDRVSKLVAIEGLGPPPEMIRDRPPHARMQQWIAEMQMLAQRHPHRYRSLDEAVARMRDANPNLTPEQARHLTIHGSYRDEDGTYLWKFDNYVRAASPYLFNMDDARHLWSQITCPTLLVRGTESWASDPNTDGRASAFANTTIVNIEKAGHWVHHDQLDKFLKVVRAFLA